MVKICSDEWYRQLDDDEYEQSIIDDFEETPFPFDKNFPSEEDLQ